MLIHKSKPRSLASREQFRLIEQQRRSLAAFAAELSSEGQDFFFMVSLKFLLDVAVFLVDSALLPSPFFVLLV
jgi:hypothetical protein